MPRYLSHKQVIRNRRNRVLRVVIGLISAFAIGAGAFVLLTPGSWTHDERSIAFWSLMLGLMAIGPLGLAGPAPRCDRCDRRAILPVNWLGITLCRACYRERTGI